MEKIMLTPSETARLLGISKSQFFRLRARGEFEGLRPIRIGKVGMYHREDVEAWLRARQQEDAA